MKQILLVVLLAFIGWFVFFKQTHVSYGPGVFAPDSPEQQELDSADSFTVDGYSITPLADFKIEAKALSIKSYRSGRESDLSPVDFAFGWGRMSDESVLENLEISQSGRWYRWRAEQLPIPRREIETHSANMHLIPDSRATHSAIKKARPGDIVEINGSLVKVEANDGWKWISSLTRNDTGRRACELIWVEDFQIKEL
ncbi:MAG: hypothetical protein OES09_17415 [Gammaproteobacteria bacterium]|nr:hypothetical protein [Gammaproteobacteria bacterium]